MEPHPRSPEGGEPADDRSAPLPPPAQVDLRNLSLLRNTVYKVVNRGAPQKCSACGANTRNPVMLSQCSHMFCRSLPWEWVCKGQGQRVSAVPLPPPLLFQRRGGPMYRRHVPHWALRTGQCGGGWADAAPPKGSPRAPSPPSTLIRRGSKSGQAALRPFGPAGVAGPLSRAALRLGAALCSDALGRAAELGEGRLEGSAPRRKVLPKARAPVRALA